MYRLFLRLLKSVYEYISRLFLHGFFIVPKSILFKTKEKSHTIPDMTSSLIATKHYLSDIIPPL